MTDRATTRTRERLGIVALLLVLLLVGLGVGTQVLPPGPTRSDAEKRFQVSTLDLTGNRRTAVLTGEEMAPGDIVVGVVTVANPSRAALLYRMVHGTVSSDDLLAASLVLDIRTVGSSCVDFDGETLYHGAFAEATLPQQPAPPRELPGASAEILCFRALLPLQSGNELQGTATSVAFRFDAEWATEAP